MYKLDKALVMTYAAQAVEDKGADHVSPLYFSDKSVDGPMKLSDNEDSLRVRGDSLCRYVTPQGKAGCIVGQVLDKLGVPLEVLAKQEGKSVNGLLGTREMQELVQADEWATKYLCDMQAMQDYGIPWGWVVENVGRRPYYELLCEWGERPIESE